MFHGTNSGNQSLWEKSHEQFLRSPRPKTTEGRTPSSSNWVTSRGLEKGIGCCRPPPFCLEASSICKIHIHLGSLGMIHPLKKETKHHPRCSALCHGDGGVTDLRGVAHRTPPRPLTAPSVWHRDGRRLDESRSRSQRSGVGSGGRS